MPVVRRNGWREAIPRRAAFNTVAARDLDETMAVFEASRDWPYSVAWVDCLARGAKLGRSLVTRGAFMARGALSAQLAREPLRPARTSRLTVPVDAPSALLNRTTISLFNALYYQRGRTRSGGVRSISRPSSLSTGLKRGTASMDAGGSYSTSAYCPRPRARSNDNENAP